MKPSLALTSQTAHAQLEKQTQRCRDCPIVLNGTRAVFGAGPLDAALMLIGEQPGDQEELQGHPFVGPAGKLLDRALAEAGIDRADVYVTNAVKHFKYIERGRRRVGQAPVAGEIQACNQWLRQELELVHPQVIVALGAVAARALCGHAMPIEANRGHWLPLGNAQLLITVHPSYLLRVPVGREEAYRRFVDDLKLAATQASKPLQKHRPMPGE